MMSLGRFAQTKTSRATAVLLTLLTLWAIVPTFSIVQPSPAWADEKIDNGDFETDTNGWSLNDGGGGIMNRWENMSAPTNGGTWALVGHSGGSKDNDVTHYADYAFTYNGGAATAILGHFWRKQNSGGATAVRNDLNIYLSGPNDSGAFGASQRVWQDTGTGNDAWAATTTTTDVLSRLSAGGNGSWTMRVEYIVQNSDSGGQVRGAVDLLSLDTQIPPSDLTVGNGSDPSSVTVIPGDTSRTVDAFTLQTNGGTDNITALSVTGSGDTTSGAVSSAKIYKDNNSNGVADAGDTLEGSGTFSGTTAIVSGLSITASTTLQRYVVAYDIAAGAGNNAALTGRVTAVTSGYTKIYNDSGSATLTVDAASPDTVTQFQATDSRNERVPLSWVNPGDTDFGRVRVLRRTDQYPVNATDTAAFTVYDASGTASVSENIVDTLVNNNQTYYYAAFTRDNAGNWNNTRTAGITADTAAPNAALVGDSASAVADTTVTGGNTNIAVGAFIMKTTGGSDTITTMTVSGSAETTQDNVATARLFSDAGTLGLLDGADTTIASAAFSGSTALFTGLSISVGASASNYLIAYDIAANPAHGAQLTGYVASATASTYEVLASTDTADATLTVDSQPPDTVTGFSASDGDDTESNLAWTNPGDADFAEVKIMRKLGSYPTSATDGTQIFSDAAAPFENTFKDPELQNGTTYYYAAFTRDTVGNWNDTVTAGTTADTGTPTLPPTPTTTIGNGSAGFTDTTVGPSNVNQTVDSFTLRTSQDTDTVTAITVTGGGDTGSGNVSVARLFSDAGTVGVLDGADTTIATANFGGNTATFGSLNLNVNTTEASYLVAYSISAGASHNAKLDGYVSAITDTTPNVINYLDNLDATLTVDTQAPDSITAFNASEYGDTTSNLSWTNPTDGDLAEVKIVRQTGSYPTTHTDGDMVANDTTAPFFTAFGDTELTNGITYYYAVFARDAYGNWNSGAVAGDNADTASPQDLIVTFGNNTQDALGDDIYHGQTNQLMQSFTLITNGGNANWSQLGLSEYGAGTAALNVGAVKLYRDDGNSVFNAGSDTALTLSPTTFSGENTTFTISGGEILTLTSQKYYVVYDLADGATPESTVTVGSRLGADGSILLSSGSITGIDPAKSSGLATLYPDIVTVTGQNTAPSPTITQGQTNDFLRLALTTNFGTATWTGLTVDRTGTGSDSDVSWVKIYKSADGTWHESDTLIGLSTFSGGVSTINFAPGDYQTVGTGVSSYYFIVYDISETADVSSTVGALVDSNGTIYLSAPDGVGAFSSSSSEPEIEVSLQDATPPTTPTNLTATSTVASQVELEWDPADDPESGISGYKIYRGWESFTPETVAASATVIATIGPVTSYTDTTETGLITGEFFYYAISAINGLNMEGGASNVASVTVSGKEVPHYNFSVTTNRCRICHKLHNSPAQAKVFRKFPEIQICFTCHDGSGSTYNIQQKWADSAHSGTETVLYSADTFIQCVKCHNPHGADPDYGTPFFLSRRVEENLCFKCHSSTGDTPVPSKNGWYIEDQMNSSVTVSRHAVISTNTVNPQGYYPEGTATTADGLPGARIECTNCHNPMVIQRGTLGTSFLVRLIDPFNVWNLWQDNTRGVSATFVNFCLNCHNSSSTPVKEITDTTIVPYTIAFPTVDTTDYPFFFGWDKTAYRDEPSAHFSNAVICGNCHNPHGSRNQRLMAFGYDANTATPVWNYYYDDTASNSKEQNLCYQCHKAAGRTGYTSAPDVQTQFAKTFKMPVATNDRHKDTEQQSDFDDNGGNRHVECYDCHDPHKAKSGMRGKNNLAGGPLNGAIGVSVTNNTKGVAPTFAVKRGVTYEYELCFKCHSSYVDLGYDSDNLMDHGDKALEFNTLNSSFMPVEGAGHNDSSNLDDQLIGDMDTDSIISCTDCHNNDNTPSGSSPNDAGWVVNSPTASTTEAVGPHGSDNNRQLRAYYQNTWLNGDGPSSWSSGSNFALCFLCHDSGTGSSGLRGGGTNYRGGDKGNLHLLHLSDRIGDTRATCKNCHWNPHGNEEVQPDNTDYDVDGTVYDSPPPTSVLKTTRLINFSPDVGALGSRAQPTWYINTTTNVRGCDVTCHGSSDKMDGETYGTSEPTP